MIYANWAAVARKYKSNLVESEKKIRIRYFLIKDHLLEEKEEVYSAWVEHNDARKLSWIHDLMQESGILWFIRETDTKNTIYFYSTSLSKTLKKLENE